MKNFRLLLILILACVLIIPFGVFAEEKTNTDNKEVIIYFFRGEGCSHCAEFEAWLKEIEPEYGNLFKVKDYEVWNNDENKALQEKVAENRGEKAEGVPYIIVGNKSWVGFAEDDKEEILSEIQSLYETDPADRYDTMALLPKDKKNNVAGDVLSVIIIVLVGALIVFGIGKARKNVN